MKAKYRQSAVSITNSESHFDGSPNGTPERSSFTATPTVQTTFNAGNLIPFYYIECLPHSKIKVDFDFVIRQTTVTVPTMGQMQVDFYAFFVPHRIVNKSYDNVIAKTNSANKWVATDVDFAPLVAPNDMRRSVQVPVMSIADYYGFPTQQPIPIVHLKQMNDLKFRGYDDIYNNYFRDQNYQDPVPFSKLNVYNGYFESIGNSIGFGQTSVNSAGSSEVLDFDYVETGELSLPVSTGSFAGGAVAKALYGNGYKMDSMNSMLLPYRKVSHSALQSPYKANKLHDYFTSVLPTSQKGNEVLISFSTSTGGPGPQIPVVFGLGSRIWTDSYPLQFAYSSPIQSGSSALISRNNNTSPSSVGFVEAYSATSGGNYLNQVKGMNLEGYVDFRNNDIGLTLSDIRISSAIQRVYEIMARSGTRYIEYLDAMFGLRVNDRLKDIPVFLGKYSKNLDLFQTAQTSASQSGSTPQGNLSAFGYTNSGGKLFDYDVVEHGYIHILLCVRHRNVYTAFLAQDNFRRNGLDFYQYPLANISEQPLYTREINPFASNLSNGDPSVFGYQEAWAAYRYEPSRVSGLMRTGVSGSMAFWNYVDDFIPNLQIADGDWLKSNSEEVLNRTLATTSQNAPQFLIDAQLRIFKILPMPTYSVPGMDVI